jgi:pyruvate kinase
VDLVALSFVQTADDVQTARSVMTDAGRSVPVIAKIERPAAVDNLTAILSAADGVMVARGDLGLEMPLEQLPRVQKQIVRGSSRMPSCCRMPSVSRRRQTWPARDTAARSAKPR